MNGTSILAREVIDQCLDKVADHVASGASPNEAIVHAVKTANLHPSGIQLLVQAYNTAAINQQRLLGQDVHEKTASVPLADTDQIMETIFPTPYKSAHAAALGETALLRKIASEPAYAPPREQTLAGLALLRTAQPPVKQAAAAPEKPYFTQRNEALKRESEANREVFNVGIKLSAAIEKLTDYLQQDAAPAVVELAPRIKAAVGDVGVKSLYAIAGKLPHLKLASKCRDFLVGVDLVREVATGLQKYELAKVAAVKAADAVPPARVPVKAVHHTKSLVADDNDAVMKELNVSDTGTKLAADKAAAGPFTTAAVLESVRHLTKSLSNNLTSDPVDKNLSALSDPMHERQLQQIRSQATLVDLMNNDSVIAGHDPDEVIAAYNQLLELSPQLGDRRILAQGALRTRLAQGGLDPFAAGQMVDLGQRLTPKMPEVTQKKLEPLGRK